MKYILVILILCSCGRLDDMNKKMDTSNETQLKILADLDKLTKLIPVCQNPELDLIISDLRKNMEAQ